MGIISKDDLFDRLSLRSNTSEIDFLGEKLLIRPLTLKELDRLNRGTKGSTTDQINARVIQMAVVNEDGSQYFSTEDIDRLVNLAAGPLFQLQRDIMALCGLTEAAADAIRKNSERIPADKSDS